MIKKLEELERKHEELTRLLAEPEILANQEKYKKIVAEYTEITPAVKLFKIYKQIDQRIAETEVLLNGAETDPEMLTMAEEELANLNGEKEGLIGKLEVSLVPQDPKEKGNAILEIRAGTGGDEASLFAADLFRMYTRYAEKNGWKIETMDSHYTGVGGIKEIISLVSGKDAYKLLRYESGVHRVQRVPKTEASGRIHTSAVTVAVLPEVEEVEIHIEEKDLRIDRFCSTGPGGQSVNTTYSAIRITHLPTGLVVTCQDEKSQIKNKEKAMKVLRSRLYEAKALEQHEAMATERKSQIGTGDRSEKIRTYNFPQSRVTDHRIGLTLHQLESVLDGDLDKFPEDLHRFFLEEKLKENLDKM
jgi:peptide chain release factor 1